MQFKSILAVLAAGLSLVAAEVDTTTTSTQTLTKTITITQCNPTATNCPGRTETTTTTQTSWTFPASNTTTTVGPTGGVPSSIAIPTSSLPGFSGSSGANLPPSQTQEPSPIVTGAAGSLFVQPALLLGAVAAGVAALA